MTMTNTTGRGFRAFSSGAFAKDTYGTLEVAVPSAGLHTSTVRSDALVFARSVWGTRAIVSNYLSPVTLRDVRGKDVPGRMYSIVLQASGNTATQIRKSANLVWHARITDDITDHD